VKKKIKIFESGKYPQGEFSTSRIKKIFGGIKKNVEAIYIHTSKWEKEGKAPVNVGEFGDFEVVEKNGDAVVYSEIEFNDKGKNYYNDGIFKGVSVEIPKDVLTKIALLPVGVNPQIKGAEFESIENYIEFEEFANGGGRMELSGVIEFLSGLDVTETNTGEFQELQEVLWKKQDQAWFVKKLKEEGYAVSKEFSKEELEEFAEKAGFELKEHVEPQTKTEEELRREIKAEFSRESERDTLKEKALAMVPPVLKGLVEFSIDEAYKNENFETIVEFSEEDKTPAHEHLKKVFEGKGPFAELFSEKYKGVEFQKTEENKADEIIANAKKIAEEVM
jgi:hypothetical protein